MSKKISNKRFTEIVKQLIIKEMKSITEGYNRYFDEHDSIDNYNLKLISHKVIKKGDYDEHILTVTGLPKIGHLNTRHSTWEEMLDFIAKYSIHKDDEIANIIQNLSYSDDLTIKEDGQEFTFSAYDIGDFARAERKNMDENYDDDDLDIYSGDFDPSEFEGAAMKAAMKDIGDDFVPLGKSKFEKNLDPEEFKADLKRQNLKLPKDKEKLNKIQKHLDVKKSHEKQFGAGSLNEFDNEGPQPGDVEYHYPGDDRAKGFGKFNDIDWDVIFPVLVNNTKAIKYKKPIDDITYSTNNFEEIGISKDELNLLQHYDIIYIWDGMPIIDDEKYLNYNAFITAAKHAWEKAQLSENAISRPTDAEGNPITLKARVEDIATKSVGRVIRFGVDDNGKQTVHVEWIQNFGGQVPNTITYTDKILVRDSGRNIKEDELEESSIRSHANGRGQNIKPGNYPKILKRKGLSENLDQVNDVDDEVFLVIDNPFNRAHYNDLVGKTFDNPPGYAQVEVVKKSEVTTNEDFDYAAAEREHTGQQELDTLKADAKNYVPENLQQFLDPNSFTISRPDNDGKIEYSYVLRIPKQADETLKDIEKFIKEEEPHSYNGPGQSYQKVSIYTVLEKATNIWVITVSVTRGYDI